MKDEFLDIISDNITCDTGNWGECGGLNRQSKIDAAESCEALCKQKMKEFAEYLACEYCDSNTFFGMRNNLKKGEYINAETKEIFTTDQLIDEFLKQ